MTTPRGLCCQECGSVDLYDDEVTGISGHLSCAGCGHSWLVTRGRVARVSRDCDGLRVAYAESYGDGLGMAGVVGCADVWRAFTVAGAIAGAFALNGWRVSWHESVAP